MLSSLKPVEASEGRDEREFHGMLVVPLKGARYEFWSPLLCSRHSKIFLRRHGLVRVANEKKKK